MCFSVNNRTLTLFCTSFFLLWQCALLWVPCVGHVDQIFHVDEWPQYEDHYCWLLKQSVNYTSMNTNKTDCISLLCKVTLLLVLELLKKPYLFLQDFCFCIIIHWFASIGQVFCTILYILPFIDDTSTACQNEPLWKNHIQKKCNFKI